MFEKLKAKSAPSGQAASTSSKKEQPLTNRFVGELVKRNTRITYAALASAAEQLEAHTPTGLSAGQRGAGITKNLPSDLQPFVCRANGSYKAGTEWPEVDVDIARLKKLDRVTPSEVTQYVQAFLNAIGEEDQPSEEEPAEPEVDEDSEISED